MKRRSRWAGHWPSSRRSLKSDENWKSCCARPKPPTNMPHRFMEATEPVQVSRRLIAVQAVMGFCAWLFLWLPYGRRLYGVEKLDTRQRYLFVCNHISLLDTILLGALFWRSKNYPIMV